MCSRLKSYNVRVPAAASSAKQLFPTGGLLSMVRAQIVIPRKSILEAEGQLLPKKPSFIMFSLHHHRI